MRERNLERINKYGKKVVLPPQTGNAGVRMITEMLDACGIAYETEYRIDACGCRKSPFDIAVLKNGVVKLFIEYDGEAHYNRDFYLGTGVREERCMAHVVKAAIGEAKKTAMAARLGVPVLHINAIRDDALRDRILAWVEVFVNEVDTKPGNEIIMINMLRKYGFDFPYTSPSNMTKAEKTCVEALMKGGATYA